MMGWKVEIPVPEASDGSAGGARAPTSTSPAEAVCRVVNTTADDVTGGVAAAWTGGEAPASGPEEGVGAAVADSSCARLSFCGGAAGSARAPEGRTPELELPSAPISGDEGATAGCTHPDSVGGAGATAGVKASGEGGGGRGGIAGVFGDVGAIVVAGLGHTVELAVWSGACACAGHERGEWLP